MKTVRFDDIQVGDEMPAYTTQPITRTHLARYAGASGDFNPIHYDETFARAVGLDGVIVHGMFIMGVAGEAVAAWIDNRQLRGFSVKFLTISEPMNLDDADNTRKRATITVTAKVVEKFEEQGEKRIRCDLIAQDGHGSRKLSGFFIAALP